LPLIHAHDTPVRANKNFGSAGDFCRQRQREIEFSAWCHVLGHDEINTASRDIASLAIVGTGLTIDRQADEDWQR
jgi:hypothetical protein